MTRGLLAAAACCPLPCPATARRRLRLWRQVVALLLPLGELTANAQQQTRRDRARSHPSLSPAHPSRLPVEPVLLSLARLRVAGWPARRADSCLPSPLARTYDPPQPPLAYPRVHTSTVRLPRPFSISAPVGIRILDRARTPGGPRSRPGRPEAPRQGTPSRARARLARAAGGWQRASVGRGLVGREEGARTANGRRARRGREGRARAR